MLSGSGTCAAHPGAYCAAKAATVSLAPRHAQKRRPHRSADAFLGNASQRLEITHSLPVGHRVRGPAQAGPVDLVAAMAITASVVAQRHLLGRDLVVDRPV